MEKNISRGRYLHSITELRALDSVNRQFSQAISVATDFDAATLAWFRRGMGGK